MTSPFRAKIRRSLADSSLQSALDANAERRISVRQKAFASLQDPQAMRQRAHAVRAEVIANLDGYIEQFMTNAQAHGLIIHRAADAAQAVQLVLEIASQGARSIGPAPLIAKSKTMVSEEIGLNHALEKAGLRVVETDLGEYIVQIRHEPPSHIITPAVHLSRAEVGKTFHEVLGIPLTDDVPTLTTAARRVLREVFLSSDVGLSGVNFGVAETGTLCVVTNEGNGRMVTTLPRVHIALMGMERLLPTLDDLALMLALLPRSATGQKLSAYVSLLNSPRRASDPDGPQERHVILVDNGRSAILCSPLEEILYCIRCGACLNACPVFRKIGGHAYVRRDGKHSPYPGPIGSVLSPALFGQGGYGQLARASSLCGACREACPVDIDLPRLLLRVRAGQVKAGAHGHAPLLRVPTPNTPPTLSLGLRIFTWVATSPGRFAIAQRLAGVFAGLAARLFPSRGTPDRSWLRLPALTGWGYSKDFPRPAVKPFRARFRSMAPEEIYQFPAAPQLTGTPEAVEPPEDALAGQGKVDLVEDLALELAALGATFSRCRKEQLVDRVNSILRQREIGSILAWGADQLPAGLLDGLELAGIQVQQPSAATLENDCKVRAGLTGALAAAAETGSLLLASGSGRPLTASLLPEIHIAIIHQRDIYASLGQVLKRREIREASAAVLVSGPSRTGDIEMTLTIGVHGPGELHVLCIAEEGGED